MINESQKYAIVTGGTKGIGKKIVQDLLKRKYYVYTNFSFDIKAAEKSRKDFLTISPHFEVLQADQSDIAKFNEFVTYCKSKITSLDCIVCNAGMTIRKPISQIANEEWEAVLNVVVNSHFYLIRDCIDIIPNNSRILFIGSSLGIYPHSISLPYGVGKAALHSLALNLIKVFEGTNTTVNVIAPGFVDTEWQTTKPVEIRNNIIRKTAVKRLATVGEISNAVMFCIDNAFVNGSIIEINGGYDFK